MQRQQRDEAVVPAGVAFSHPAIAPPDIATLRAHVSPDLPHVVVSRFLREHAWLKHLPGIGPAASLLAAHAAGCMALMRPGLEYPPPGLPSVYAALAGVRPSRADLDKGLDTLEDFPLPPGDPGREAAVALAEALWPVAAPTEYLLASGGDDRLRLAPQTGLNKYGCAPWPRPEVISFGSCTASSLSQGAFEAAENARKALVAAALATSPATALAEASEAIADAVLRHFGVEDLAEAVLAASGTDAALVVTGLLAAERPGCRFTSILVSPSETGSGVPHAVQGCHFASCAPSGNAVFKGHPIDGLPEGPGLVTVALRGTDGAPRPTHDIDAACEAAIRAGAAVGQVVLHAMDGSKTGLTAPDSARCRRLAELFGDRLDIVIDACQARIEPPMVRWYLLQGFPVLLTGSKFFGAPGFCGAVLFPRARLRRITQAGRLPAGLAAYARLQGGFGSRRCPGLILRWTAALHEMAAFAEVPAQDVRARLEKIGAAIRAALAVDDRIALVDAPRSQGMGWSDCRSVFTFTVRGPEGLMNQARLRPLYLALAEGGSPCQIGQPVDLGSPALGGLRLAISAAHIVEGASQSENLAFVMSRLRKVMDR
jgi:hypothetical protein